jgi:dTDP-4-dehydrorhamnose reductase
MRYPVLWERTMRKGDTPDWSWPDRRLRRIHELAITPIVGLVHHGSGPPDTSLLDAGFAPKLAAYARRVAERYPWVDHFTPVNEPLTTARFSTLYGHWYPHERNDRAFVRALLNETRATVLAMHAIRHVRSDARLVQTEDMGFTRSTEDLTYQADFENERRFLSFDLLAGKVSPSHGLYEYLVSNGASERELGWLCDSACPPDVIGIDYYVTSERFLDGRIHLYPKHVVGGNGRHAYADVEAVRVCRDGLIGVGNVILETWDRYGLPIAVTESHLGCTVDQQILWLLDVWQKAHRARESGADVRAVTAWALLGSHGWANLVTTKPKTYEAGAFAVENGRLRKTALGCIVETLCCGGISAELDFGIRGWWESSERLLYEPHVSSRRAVRARLRTEGAVDVACDG